MKGNEPASIDDKAERWPLRTFQGERKDTMHGQHTIDLAMVLADARRAELAEALHAKRSSAVKGGVREAIGLRLIRTGMRLVGAEGEIRWEHA